MATFIRVVDGLISGSNTAGDHTTHSTVIEPPDNGPSRQRGVAERDLDLLNRHACFIRGELGQDGIGARADVLSGAGDTAAEPSSRN